MVIRSNSEPVHQLVMMSLEMFVNHIEAKDRAVVRVQFQQ